MVKREMHNRQGEGLRPEPALRELLSVVDGPAELLPWSTVERLVASAPPVRVPWWSPVVGRATLRLRYVAATLLVLLMGSGVLAVLPAQSDAVGTLALTKLPSAWQIGGAAFDEVKQAAQAEFAVLELPQAELFTVVGERAGRDELAFAMLGADRRAAERFLTVMRTRYPALAAFDAEFTLIDTNRFGSRLNELMFQLTHSGRLGNLDDAALQSFVLSALSASGFGDVENVTITRRPDGKIVIEVDASLSIAVEQGRTQEELAAAGLSEGLLGEETFQRLLGELAAVGSE